MSGLSIMILGLAIFLGGHLFTIMRGQRAALIKPKLVGSALPEHSIRCVPVACTRPRSEASAIDRGRATRPPISIDQSSPAGTAAGHAVRTKKRVFGMTSVVSDNVERSVNRRAFAPDDSRVSSGGGCRSRPPRRMTPSRRPAFCGAGATAGIVSSVTDAAAEIVRNSRRVADTGRIIDVCDLSTRTLDRRRSSSVAMNHHAGGPVPTPASCSGS